MIFICVTHDDSAEAERYFAQLVAKHVDGILLASHNDAPFRIGKAKSVGQTDQMLPLVTVDWPESAGYVVLLDLENAGYQATKHLLEHGHSRVGMITVDLKATNVFSVNNGYERALHQAGIASDPGLIVRMPGFDLASGAIGAQKLMELEHLPTAIFAINDLLAIGAMQHLQKNGFRIPEDIAIIGFNDIPLSEMVNPQLTTVSAPVYQMGQKSIQMLQSLVAGKRPAHKTIILPTSLVIRQSCGTHNIFDPH